MNTPTPQVSSVIAPNSRPNTNMNHPTPRRFALFGSFVAEADSVPEFHASINNQWHREHEPCTIKMPTKQAITPKLTNTLISRLATKASGKRRNPWQDRQFPSAHWEPAFCGRSCKWPQTSAGKTRLPTPVLLTAMAIKPTSRCIPKSREMICQHFGYPLSSSDVHMFPQLLARIRSLSVRRLTGSHTGELRMLQWLHRRRLWLPGAAAWCECRRMQRCPGDWFASARPQT